MDDTLVGAATEMKIGIPQFSFERAVHKSINIWKYLAQTLISKDFLVSEAGIAPYILAGLFLYATGQFREGFHLIERVATGEGDIGEFIGLDHFQEFIHADQPAAVEIP
jgi:hypothetical protein